MPTCHTPRILITAPNSGTGKTTVVCAILALLQQRGFSVAAFKCGPDYIDPMFHTQVLGTPSRNLDTFLFGGGEQGRAVARRLMAHHAETADIAVFEGAMGYYDGVALTTESSAYDIATTTETPVIAVVDGRGAALSLAAQIDGLARFRHDSRVVGFIVNHVRPSVYAYYKDSWEKETGLLSFGYMPDVPEGAISSRHLGLVTAGEIDDLKARVQALAAAAQTSIDVNRLIEVARTAPAIAYDDEEIEPVGDVRLAVARDEAFCFYYEDELRLLEMLGARLVPFSPLYDAELPPCDGLYIGGGYPEIYAKELEGNRTMRRSINDKLTAGLPCFAECGGYMYLLDHFDDGEKTYDWVGALDGTCYMKKSLIRFGYVTLTAQEDTILCQKGDTIHAHEFHYSDSTQTGSTCIAKKAGRSKSWPCFIKKNNIFAGYPHLHLWGNPKWAKNFIASLKKETK